MLDAWLADLGAADFEAMLPLLRRTFSAFQPGERRAMGELVRGLRGTGPPRQAHPVEEIDPPRADLVMPVLAAILGGRV
jgi:hypothetical protein